MSNAALELSLNFVDTILAAEAVRKDVTINSYEAYTTGEISDIAQAMQNYADSIRLTRASGNLEDVSMLWGGPDSGGMEFTIAGTDETYRFILDDTVAGGGTLEKKLSDGTYLMGTRTARGVYSFSDNSTFTYQPTGDVVYNISQYYAYYEVNPIDNQRHLKLHPIPIEATLTVTPVELLAVETDTPSLTFRNMIGEVPYTYSGLRLAEEARLSVDATPKEDVVTGLGGFIPTLAIRWAPNTIGEVYVEDTTPTVIRQWPQNDADVQDRVGLAIPNDSAVHQADYSFTTSVTKTDIVTKYPWLTVPDESYDLTALRRIVDTDISAPVLRAEEFELRARPDDVTGNLIIDIARKDPEHEGKYLDMAVYDVIDLYQSNGTLIDPNWFTGTGAQYANYTPQRLTLTWAQDQTGNDCFGYRITLATASHSSTFAALLTLQQNINLGGWFSAELEMTAGGPRTDRITGYSVPRQNVYTESYTAEPTGYTAGSSPKRLFDFTEERAGLLRVYSTGSLNTLVTLPDIHAKDGESEAENWIQVRYDPTTGAEPGYLRQFKVDSWNNKTTSVTGTVVQEKYGADEFARSYVYSGYALIENPTGSDYDEEVIVRVQKQATAAPQTGVSIALTYEQYGDTVNLDSNNEVKKVSFNDKNEGYTWEQVVTLTITNTGTEELHGLYIDGLAGYTASVNKNAATPTWTDEAGQCFTILTQPAPNLAVGASTTFQISYIPNLQVPEGDEREAWYLDETLYVCNDTGTINRPFAAEIKVTEEGSYQVDLIVRPTDLSMGTAAFVQGVDTGNIYHPALVPGTYMPGSTVWVLTTPVDEYALIPKGPYYLSTEEETAVTEVLTDASGNPVKDTATNKPLYKNYLTEYNSSNLDASSPTYRTQTERWTTLENYASPVSTTRVLGERLFFFVMPEKSVTVYVDYYEPLLSKERLADKEEGLIPYAWDHNDDAGNATEWTDAYSKDLRLIDGAQGYPVVTFDPLTNEYVTLLDSTDLFCGVAVSLRELLLTDNALETNHNITPTVRMNLDDSANTLIYEEVGSTEDTGDSSDKGDVNYIHRSMLFAAPQAPGSSKTVTISITYTDVNDGLLTGTEGRVTRTYKVRFMRRPEEDNALHTANAGNSPYGLIMNDDAIDGVAVDGDGKTQKDLAKESFDANNRFTFADSLTPKVAGTSSARVLSNIYWTEAWTGGVDYDRDESALFAYLGAAFDDPGATGITNSAGELVTTTELTITLEYIQLETAATLVERFNGETTATVTLAENLVVTDGILSMTEVTDAFADVTDIRPGIYRLRYTFPDYVDVVKVDNVDTEVWCTLSFTRPFLVLSARGDVNADRAMDAADVTAIDQRYVPGSLLPIDEFNGAKNYAAADRLLYRYRIVDANNDRNINDVDAALLKKPAAGSGVTTQFYLPTDYTNHIASGS